MNKKLQILICLVLFSGLSFAQTENKNLADYLKAMEQNFINEPLKALELFDNLILLEEYQNNNLGRWEADRIAANSYLLIGDNERAFEIFNQLEKQNFSGLTDAKHLQLFNDLADAHRITGNQNLATEYYKNALNYSLSAGDPQLLANQQIKLADYYYILDSLSLSEQLYTEALTIYKNRSNEKKVAELKLNLSQVEVKKRNFDLGYDLAEEAKEYFSEKGEIKSTSRATQLMGVCKCRSGRFGPATKLLDEAIMLASQDKASINLKEFYVAKLELLIAKGESDSAKIYHNKIVQYSDSVSLAGRNTQLEMFRKRLESEKQVARKKSEELAGQKNLTLFLSIAGSLAVIFLLLIFFSFNKKRKSRNILAAKNKELDSINQKFESFLNQTEEGIVILNTSGEIILWNPYLENLIGVPGSEALNRNYKTIFEKFLLPDLICPTKIFEKIDQVMNPEASGFGDFETIIKTKNETTKTINLSYYPICTENEAFIGIICRDVSLQKEYEAELIRSKNIALASEKLKSEFLTQVSHEVRAPLNTILGYTNLLENKISSKLDEDLKDSFVSINNAGDRIIRTTDLLLNMSDVQSGTYNKQHKKINLLDEVIDPLFAQFKKEAEQKDLRLLLENSSDETTIEGDLYSTQQIIANLIDNAIKYTKEGKIEVIVTEENPYLCVNIIDTGIGIAEDYLQHLFEPFSQEEQGYTRSFEGNGLGLALVKNYCELNNYNIFVRSEKNNGSSFKLMMKKYKN
ncbi:MAG: ATP-binding protein [Rhodothermaceae bacterium]